MTREGSLGCVGCGEDRSQSGNSSDAAGRVVRGSGDRFQETSRKPGARLAWLGIPKAYGSYEELLADS